MFCCDYFFAEFQRHPRKDLEEVPGLIGGRLLQKYDHPDPRKRDPDLPHDPNFIEFVGCYNPVLFEYDRTFQALYGFDGLRPKVRSNQVCCAVTVSVYRYHDVLPSCLTTMCVDIGRYQVVCPCDLRVMSNDIGRYRFWTCAHVLCRQSTASLRGKTRTGVM